MTGRLRTLALQALLAAILDTEHACQPTGSDDAERRTACERSQKVVDSQLATVKGLTTDNAEQQERLHRLTSLVAPRMNELRRGFDSAVRSTSPIDTVAVQSKIAVVSDVRSLVQAGVEEEQRLLAER